MKKFTLLILAIIWIALTANAQNNSTGGTNDNGSQTFPHFYGRVGIGGGVGLCYYDDCFYNESRTFDPSQDNLSAFSRTYGNGLNGGIAGGYMFNKNLGVELGLSAYYGFPIKQTTDIAVGESSSTNTVNKTHEFAFQVIPSVVLKTGMEKFDPYARFGLLIGAYDAVYEKETRTVGNDSYLTEGRYYGGVPVGYSVAGGVEYPNICKHFDLFAEIECNGFNYTPTKYKMTKYTVNGDDMLGTLPTKEKQTVFVKKYDYNETISNDSPNKELRESFVSSSVHLNIGFTYRF
jgi:Outer membrane protein beta-barrel domain